MTTITTQPQAAAATCRYPGCANPARLKDPAAPGPRPGYCEQDIPEDTGDGTAVVIRHTAMTAFRRRRQLAGQPDQDRPVTAAVSRAAAIRDDALTAMTRLGAQLSAALDQLAVLGDQLAAAADPEAAEAQAEAVRAETAAQIEQARAGTASQAYARHAAELDAAEARAAAAEAIAAAEAETRARQHAESAASAAACALQDERAAAQDAITAARAERDTALAAAEDTRRDAARARGQDQQRHATELATATAQLAAANDTITTLREQLARAEAALDRERAEQHRLTSFLHDLITSRQHPAGPQAAEDPEPETASPASTARRRQAPR